MIFFLDNVHLPYAKARKLIEKLAPDALTAGKNDLYNSCINLFFLTTSRDMKSSDRFHFQMLNFFSICILVYYKTRRNVKIFSDVFELKFAASLNHILLHFYV